MFVFTFFFYNASTSTSYSSSRGDRLRLTASEHSLCVLHSQRATLAIGTLSNTLALSNTEQCAIECGCPLTSCHTITIPSPCFHHRDAAGGTPQVATCNPSKDTVRLTVAVLRTASSQFIPGHGPYPSCHHITYYHILSLFFPQVEHLEHLWL